MVEIFEPKEVMTEMLEAAVREGKLFRVDGSFLLAAQIPDDSIGCSGSRCSNCDSKTAYCKEICEGCGLPFVGPFGFPQIPDWKQLSLEEKNRMVRKIYNSENHGRLGYVGVELIPLNPNELKKVENLGWEDSGYFSSAHGISPQEIKMILFS